MNIGFDISQTGAGKAGCGFYAHALAESLAGMAAGNEIRFFPSFGDFYLDPSMKDQKPYSGKGVSYAPAYTTREASGEFWNAPDLQKRLDSLDLMHANNFWCPLGLDSTRLIYTFYDMAFLAEPSWSTEANRLGCFEGIFRAAAFADWIVSISKASRDHFLEVFPHFPEDRIRVIYPSSRFKDTKVLGVCPQHLTALETDKFWLSVGTIEPRKNQLGLAKAYAQYRQKAADPLPLVFAGGKGWLMEHFQDEIDALGLGPHVHLTGYVSDEELIWLYRNCFANLYPSFFEGFGLPVLEAMQWGAPTLASNATSIPEVLGGAGPLIVPSDTQGWASAMLALQSEPSRRNEMRRAGIDRVSTFQWEESTKALLNLYEEAIQSPKREGSL